MVKSRRFEDRKQHSRLATALYKRREPDLTGE